MTSQTCCASGAQRRVNAADDAPIPPSGGGRDNGDPRAPSAAEDAPIRIEGDKAAECIVPPARFGRARRAILGAGAFVLICASAAASGYICWQHHNLTRQQERTADYASAARKGAISLMSLDFSHAKECVQRVIADSTGPFKDQLQSAAPELAKHLEESNVLTKPIVNGVAVESATESTAVVLVAVTSEDINSRGAERQPHSWRLLLGIAEDAGLLKISRVEVVA